LWQAKEYEKMVNLKKMYVNFTGFLIGEFNISIMGDFVFRARNNYP